MAPPSLASTRLELPRLELPDDIRRQLVSARDLTTRRVPAALPAGLGALDALLEGGLPKGGLVEVFGRRSSGRFTLGLHALAAATQAGEAAALVDLGDHLDPQAAVKEGVELARLLWLRPRRLKAALLAAETVLSTGFALVVFDLGYTPFRRRDAARRSDAGRKESFRPPENAWIRLSRLAEARGAALLVLSPYRLTGPAAGVVLTAESARAVWASRSGGSPLLLGLASRLTLQKRRGETPGAASPLVLRVEEALKTSIFQEGLSAPRPAFAPSSKKGFGEIVSPRHRSNG